MLLGSVSDYLDASPNYWAPLLDDSPGEPAQLHEPPPPSTKPSHSIFKSSSSFINKPLFMSVHWRDTMILRRKVRKLREKLARSMAKHALDDRATEAAAARLADHDAKNEDHKAKTHPTLVTDRMADALPRDGKSSSAGVSNRRFSRDPRPQPSIATKDTLATDGDRSVAPLPPEGSRALAMSAMDHGW